MTTTQIHTTLRFDICSATKVVRGMDASHLPALNALHQRALVMLETADNPSDIFDLLEVTETTIEQLMSEDFSSSQLDKVEKLITD